MEHTASDPAGMQYATRPMFPEHKALHIDKDHKRANEAKRFARDAEGKLRIDMAETAAKLRRTLARLDQLEAEGITELSDQETPDHD